MSSGFYSAVNFETGSNMNKSLKKFLFLPLLFFLFTPFFILSFDLVNAQVLPDAGDGVGEGSSTTQPPPSGDSESSGLVPACGGKGQPECGWLHLVELAENIMNFLIAIALPLSAVAFAYAGFLYLTAAGSEDKIKKAHGVFVKVAIGLFFVLAAWAIVYLIASTLLQDDFSILNLKK